MKAVAWARMKCLVRLAWLVALAALAGLSGCDRGSYTRAGGGWRFDGTAVPVADKRSFEPLSKDFARDKVRGYYRGLPIEGSEGASFAALSPHEARDGQHVWWAETYRKAQEYWAYSHQRVRLIEGADAASYRVIDAEHARDARRVYHRGQPFEVRDVASFEVLPGRFARDRVQGYFERRPIEGSDGASFVVLDPDHASHARDSRRIYSAHIEINDSGRLPYPLVRVLPDVADADAVRVLGRGYALDGRHVWFRGRPLAGADPASFELASSSELELDARDRRRAYREGRPLPRNSPSLPAASDAETNETRPQTRPKPG